jgi:hypothetical protein
MIFRAIASRFLLLFFIHKNLIRMARRFCSQWLISSFQQKMTDQAFAGPNPESGPYFRHNKHRIVRELTGNVPGEGGLITFPGSIWLASIVLPHQPHFIGQPEDVEVF